MDIGQKVQFKMDLSPLVQYKSAIDDYKKAIKSGVETLETARAELRSLENGPAEDVQILMDAAQKFSRKNMEIQLEVSSIVDMYKWIHTIPELKKFIDNA